MNSSTAVSLDALRARIRELEGQHVLQRRPPSGVAVVDQLIGGLPLPGILEISGSLGSGRTRLAVSLIAALAGRFPAAWVDPLRRFFPPAAAQQGVDLQQLLLVRPEKDRESWAVEQLCRAGCFPVVVVMDPHPLGRAWQRWIHAAEAGGCTLVVLTERMARSLPACVRMGVSEGKVSVVRDRHGCAGASMAWGQPWV